VSTPTDLHPASGAVLTHPAFDRSPVHNDRRRGRKKGTHSLAMARREREAAERVAALAAASATPGPPVAASVAPQLDSSPLPLTPWQSRAMVSPPRDPLAPARLRHEDAVIGAALAIIEERMRVQASAFEQPQLVKDYLRLQLAGHDREVFGVMFLDARHGLVAFEVLFEGTLTHTAVHPREVVRRAMQLNSSAVILAHNHPSGVPEPSRADELLTVTLRQALALLDVRVIDHVIVGGACAVSFAERGLL
jgi:proteasome lid subunit RPN8/RPN11